MGHIGIISFILLTSSLALAHQLTDTPFCIYRKRGLVWNIDNLQADQPYVITDPNDPSRNVRFNICDQVKCDGEEAYAVLQTLTSCRLLTDDSNNPTEAIIDRESLGLTFKFTESENCIEDKTKSYSFELRLICSSDESEFAWVENPENPCLITMQKSTKTACPIIRANALWNFTDKYIKYIIPAVILVGIFYLLAGGYFVKTSLFIVTFFTAIVAVLFIMYGIILPFSTPDWVGWIILGASGITGLVLATIISRFIRVGVFILGCWLGGTLATCLFQLFVYKISSQPVVLYGLIVVLAIIIGVISLKFFKLVMIIGTSFIGAFITIRGLAVYIGGYPNEFQIFNDIQAGDIDNVQWPVYVYFASMVILAVLGVLFQGRMFKVFSRKRQSREYQMLSE